MIRPITGTILILAILIVIPFQAYAATPKETVEAGGQ
jgi:O-antigen ligase